MFVPSEKFVEGHDGWIDDIAVCGQESDSTTRRLAMKIECSKVVTICDHKRRTAHEENVVNDETKLILVDQIEPLIHEIRGQKVVLDSDLAALYGVPTKVLNQAIQRNLDRFPPDFRFQLTESEMDSLRSQIVTCLLYTSPSPRD